MDTNSHMALMAEPLNNVPMVPGAGPLNVTYTAVGPLGWLVLIAFLAVCVLGILMMARLVKKHLFATAGLVSFGYAIALWFLVNLLQREFRGTAIRDLMSDLQDVVSQFVFLVLLLLGIGLVVFGIYKLEKLANSIKPIE